MSISGRIGVSLLAVVAMLNGCVMPLQQPTPTSIPSPTPLPSFGPFIPVGEPVTRNSGTTTEVVRNCVEDGEEPVVKLPSRSIADSHSVEWVFSGRTGVGTKIGGGLLPVEVDLTASLETTYGQHFSQSVQKGTGWQLPAKVNTIVTYILEWEEVWQPGYVEVRFYNEPILKIDVLYRTDVRSEIAAEDKQPCDNIASLTDTTVAVPTNTSIPPTAINTPLPTRTSPNTAVSDCIHPEILAQQNGWVGVGLVDEYGGYRVQLNQPDLLPDLWEANGERSIHQLDTARQMSVGFWIIYTPYDCREGFGFSSADKTSAECVHPETLLQQNGWTGLGLVDRYGGYRVELSQPDQLPPLWEANGPRPIRQLDSEREMTSGTWIIYTPYSCRSVFGFEK